MMWFNKTSNSEYNEIFFRLMKIPDFKLIEMKEKNNLENSIIDKILKSRGKQDDGD